jgi:hypothetical protein
VYLACFIDWRPRLAVGEQAIVAVIAFDRDQAKVIINYIKGLLRSVDVLEELIDDELTETIRLNNQVTIEIHTARIASPRGRTYAAVLADELAFWKTELSSTPDADVINAVRPGLATLAPLGSMLLMASSPYAKRGVLYETFKRHYGKDDSRVLVWKAPTLTMNYSDALKEIVDEAYADDPVSAAAEYGAEFRSDVGAYIDRAIVEACIATGLHERPPEHKIQYAAFVDPSGGSADSFTIAIGHREGDCGALDCIRERRPPFSPEAVVNEFADLMRSYRITRCTGDRYGGLWPSERFQEAGGVVYEPSERTKSEIYQELLPLLNSHRVELLDDGKLVTQLCGLERRTARGG